MLPLATIAKKIRRGLHDTDSITYDDEDIIDAINCGMRFIRRTIADIQPAMLATEHKGVLSPGQSSIVISGGISKVLSMTLGSEINKTVITYHSDKIYHNYNRIYQNRNPLYSETETVFYKEHPIYESEQAHSVWDSYNDGVREGTPEVFYRTGIATINLYPIPNETTAYTIVSIDDLDELTLKDKSPLLTEFDDFLVEYAVTRLSITNEYDVAQESQVLANIVNQIQRMLVPPPDAIEVYGYWDSPVHSRGGYR